MFKPLKVMDLSRSSYSSGFTKIVRGLSSIMSYDVARLSD